MAITRRSIRAASGHLPQEPHKRLLDKRRVPFSAGVRGAPQHTFQASREQLFAAIRARGQEPVVIPPRTEPVDLPLVTELSALTEDPVFGQALTTIAEKAGPSIALGCAYVFMGFTVQEAYRLSHHLAADAINVRSTAAEFATAVNFWKITLVSRFAPHRLKLLSRATALLDDPNTPRELRWGIIHYFIGLEYDAQKAVAPAESGTTIYNQLILATDAGLQNRINDAILARPSLRLGGGVVEGEAREIGTGEG